MSKEPEGAFSGILEGWDPLIREHYQLRHSIKRKTAAKDALTASPNLSRLFEGLYECIEGNFSRGKPSKNLNSKNWVLHEERKLNFTKSRSGSHKRLEKRLEKRIASLAVSQHECDRIDGSMAGWYNQVPAASGYFGPAKNKLNSIDLVHERDRETGREYAFVELKLRYRSGSPFYAAYEILSYGFLYLFTRSDVRLRAKFAPIVVSQRLLAAEVVRLIVLAPETYYLDSGQTDAELIEFEKSINSSLTAFARERQSGLTMTFEFRRFFNPVASEDEIDRFREFDPAPDGASLADPT
jgi:hypothetical protein